MLGYATGTSRRIPVRKPRGRHLALNAGHRDIVSEKDDQ